MGLILSRILHLFKGRERKILFLGLDNSGKTTLLYQLKLKKQVTTQATVGFNVETITPFPRFNLIMWDVGGQDKLRSLWKHYYKSTDAVIFMVDSSDLERIEKVQELLCELLSDEDMMNIPVIILANKQDLPNALKSSELFERLQLQELITQGHQIVIQGISATTGEGTLGALKQLQNILKNT